MKVEVIDLDFEIAKLDQQFQEKIKELESNPSEIEMIDSFDLESLVVLNLDLIDINDIVFTEIEDIFIDLDLKEIDPITALNQIKEIIKSRMYMITNIEQNFPVEEDFDPDSDSGIIGE